MNKSVPKSTFMSQRTGPSIALVWDTFILIALNARPGHYGALIEIFTVEARRLFCVAPPATN
jgi:hypothetical protein